MISSSDTIFALATGAGKSAIAIIRVSGSQCEPLLHRICKRQNWPRREAVYAGIFDENAVLIDRAIVLVFDAPLSFTGEDMIEFQITGSRGVKSAVLRILKLCPGTRAAEPGEFARRAFENGKLDLAQVEGLASMVDAESEAEARHAALMAFGTLSRECELARVELLQVASYLEGFLDFSDVEDEMQGSTLNVSTGLERALTILQALNARSRVSERLREGYIVAIVGKPNAGKSTLINCILQRDAVIVSDIPGTTRDYLEFSMEISGFPVVMIDTAGYRSTLDPIEVLGIKRSKDRIHAADLILWLSDTGFQPDTFLPDNIDTIRVSSKGDLSDSHRAYQSDVVVSGLTGDGISRLIELIQSKARVFFEDYDRPALGSRRQVTAVVEAITFISRALADLSRPEELIAEEIRGALAAVGRVTGRVDVEHVLDEVFSRLCVGK